MRLQEMQVVWGKLIEGGTTTSDELKTLKQALQKSKQGAKIIRGGRGNSGQTGNSRGRRKKIISALCIIISYV